MSDFINNISQFIQEQFPAHYRDQINVDPTAAQRAVIIDFMEAYYEWIESVEGESFIRNRQMFEFRDIDQTHEDFVKYFRNTFLRDLAYDTATDDRYVIKHILDLYRAKGSPASIKLMLRLLFNVDSEVYFPGKDVLRPSDSRWINPIYVEVISSERSVNLVGKGVFGSISGATAFVEAVVTKRSNNRLIDILYLSDVVGTFVFNDIITDDGVLIGAPKVIGSLSSIEINQNTVGGNQVGDLFEISAEFGQGGVARVTAVKGQSGAVEFSVEDGGYGYTTTADTQILVSDVVVIADNSNTIFETNAEVVQQLEKIYLDPDFSSDFLSEISVGDTVVGLDDTSNAVSNATIMSIGSETLNSIITPYIVVQTEGDTTFLKNQTITLTEDTTYIVGRILEEADDITLSIASANGSFINGEIVFQRQFLAQSGNTISSTYAFGEVVSSNSTVINLTNAFGDFIDDVLINGRDSGAEATVESSNVTFEGTTGIIKSQTTNNEYIVIVETEFSGNNKIRGVESKVISEIDSSSTVSIITVEANNEQANVQSTANVYFTGTVIGQNTTNIGIASTSEDDFILLSNTSVISDGITEFTVDAITSGTGATFEIGTLENTETIDLKYERIVDTNIFGIEYQNINISGSGSGIGFVDSVSINSGGSGYTNSSAVTFSGGGFLDQNPLIPASATVTTDGSGVITSINIIEIGEGYFGTPSISVADGSGANLEVQMTFGYGFPKDILANSNTIISDALDTANVTIGTIATLTGNRPGTGYTGRPFVTVRNPKIASFSKQDQIAEITPTFGVFVTGEIVTQANSAAKGIVLESDSSTIKLRNISFTEDFTANSEIIGSTSAARADINTISYDTTARVMGENAIINNFVVEAPGVIDTVAIVNSGLGYIDGETVTIFKDGAPITGTARVQQQGVAPGYWKTRTSHISSEKKLHDNDYWQEFSYDIKSPVSLNEYRDIFLDVLHISGTKLFGSVVKSNDEQVTVTSESTITQS